MKCPKCGEPWDLDSLHDEVSERFGRWDPAAGRTVVEGEYEPLFREVRQDFAARGCRAIGGRCSDTVANPAVAELYDLLGDDIDGAIALIEDFGL